MIAEEELNGKDRAKYGASVIKELSKRLTASYGKGFTRRDLYHYLTFFKTYSDLFLSSESKVYSVSTQSHILLSWTHYRTLLQELNDDARHWYEREAVEQNWSVRTLQRNLCDDTDDDIARYSVLHDNDHIFASKYMLYMPTQEQLRNEIERQKAIYYLQHKDLHDEIEL